MNIGEAVRSIRKEKKIKLKDLAKRSGLSVTALINIERNRSFPTKPTIVSLCREMGIPVSYLMLYSITEEDVPESKREAFRVMVNPIKEFLR